NLKTICKTDISHKTGPDSIESINGLFGSKETESINKSPSFFHHHHNYWHLQKDLKTTQSASRSYEFSVDISYAVVESFDVLSGDTGVHFSGSVTFLLDFAVFQK
ncbi:hypothetical protein NPIL_654091, partial [Nephila pilipes]